MKQIVRFNVGIALLLMLLLVLTSLNTGAGYVYVNWQGWQLQTNLYVTLFLLLLISLALQLLWYAVRRALRRGQGRLQQRHHVVALHSYEQLGMLWLLSTGQQQTASVQAIFAESNLLNHVMQAKWAIQQQQWSNASEALAQAPDAASELVQLVQIEALLLQQQSAQACAILQNVPPQPQSAWLQPFAQAYAQRLNELWALLAVQQPWLYLQHHAEHDLTDYAQQQWLQQLLQQFECAQYNDLQTLQQCFAHEAPTLASRPYDTQVLWLKLLARLPDLSMAHEQLALQLLAQQFNQDVFCLWFQQKMLAQQPDYAAIDSILNRLEAQYPSLPILSFARWHTDHAQGRHEQASAILRRYPDNVLMSYLRIKNLFKDDADLIRQLNLVFNNDARLIQFKI